MADFRGVLNGAKGSCSRLGTKKSGITSILNTWHTVITTKLIFDQASGLNVLTIVVRDISSGKSEMLYEKHNIK